MPLDEDGRGSEVPDPVGGVQDEDTEEGSPAPIEAGVVCWRRNSGFDEDEGGRAVDAVTATGEDVCGKLRILK